MNESVRVQVRKFHNDGSESGSLGYSDTSEDWVFALVGVMEPGDAAIITLAVPGEPKSVCHRCLGSGRVFVTPGNREEPPYDEPALGPCASSGQPCSCVSGEAARRNGGPNDPGSVETEREGSVA